MAEKAYLGRLQGLSRATDVSNPETAEAGKKLLTGAMKVKTAHDFAL